LRHIAAGRRPHLRGARRIPPDKIKSIVDRLDLIVFFFPTSIPMAGTFAQTVEFMVAAKKPQPGQQRWASKQDRRRCKSQLRFSLGLPDDVLSRRYGPAARLHQTDPAKRSVSWQRALFLGGRDEKNVRLVV